MQSGFSPGHATFSDGCSNCHAGDATQDSKEAARRRLIARPGNLSNAAQVFGRYHADQIECVSHSLMRTGTGMVYTMRRAFGEAPSQTSTDDTLSTLGRTPADSLLRKRCAGRHQNPAMR